MVPHVHLAPTLQLQVLEGRRPEAPGFGLRLGLPR